MPTTRGENLARLLGSLARATRESLTSEVFNTTFTTNTLLVPPSLFGQASMLLDGNSDHVTVADNQAFDLGLQDFTVDFDIRLSRVMGNWQANFIPPTGKLTVPVPDERPVHCSGEE